MRNLVLTVSVPVIVLTTGAIIRRLQAQDWRVKADTQAAMQTIAGVALLVALATRLARPALGPILGALAGAVVGVDGVWGFRHAGRRLARRLSLAPETRHSLPWLGIIALAVGLTALPGKVYLLGMRGPVAVVGTLFIAHNASEKRLTSAQTPGSSPGEDQQSNPTQR